MTLNCELNLKIERITVSSFTRAIRGKDALIAGIAISPYEKSLKTAMGRQASFYKATPE